MLEQKRWLENDNIRLRAPEPEDLELMYKMENDTTLWEIGNSLQFYSRYALRNYIEQTRNDLYTERQLRFVIEHKQDKKAIGMIDIVDYSPYDARAEICVGLLYEYRSCGIGYEALTLLCDYAFRLLGLYQLYAYVPVGHEKSKRLFKKAGFLESAVLKGWKRNGEKYIDILLFQMFKNNKKIELSCFDNNKCDFFCRKYEKNIEKICRIKKMT